VLELSIRQPVERRRVKTRWGWVVVSLGLLALAGFFLYPTVENLTESESTVAPEPAPVKAALPMAAELAVPSPVKPLRKVAGAIIPPKPIREVAPMAGEAIRNRIVDEIPVYVTIRIGANGSVVGAQTATAGEGIQAYLSQRALEAVRQWKFRPAKLGPDPIPSKWTVRFRFDKSGVEWN
jgi:TonB family protein